ncbi:hypothetical protein CcaCcLH18_02186 [Colletotrichum camelliae]|nr:hypothetical protein CcaCcLH18_02186 [Colletotrichum camelliae]
MKPQLLVNSLVIPPIIATAIAPQVDQDDSSTVWRLRNPVCVFGSFTLSIAIHVTDRNIDKNFDSAISASAAFFVSYLSLINLHHLHIPTIHPAYRHFESNVVDRTSPDSTHKAVSLSHYIRFDHDSEPTLEPFIIIAISECFVILFVLAIIILNIALAVSIFAVVDAGLSYSSVNGIHLGGSRKPYLYCNINAGFSDCFQFPFNYFIHFFVHHERPFNYFIYIKPHQQLVIPRDKPVQYYPQFFVRHERFLINRSNNSNLAIIICIESFIRIQLLNAIKLLRYSDVSAYLKSLRNVYIERITHGKLCV